MSIPNYTYVVWLTQSVFKSESNQKYKNKYNISDMRYPLRFHPWIQTVQCWGPDAQDRWRHGWVHHGVFPSPRLLAALPNAKETPRERRWLVELEQWGPGSVDWMDGSCMPLGRISISCGPWTWGSEMLCSQSSNDFMCCLTRGRLSSQKILQNFLDFPSHWIFRHMHETLNIDKK
jgi:hypothetical protein